MLSVGLAMRNGPVGRACGGGGAKRTIFSYQKMLERVAHR